MPRITVAALALISFGALAAPPAAAPAAAPAAGAKPGAPAAATNYLAGAELNKLLYVLGYSVGRSLGDFSLSPAELAEVNKGVSDAVKEVDAKYPLETYGPHLRELAEARGSVKAAANKKKGEEFQAKAAKEAGATKMPSGLIINHIKQGDGPQPKDTDTVKVHYKGTLTDGKEFDSSYKRGEPAEFPLNGVIRCWTEGVAKMKVGGKAKLVCPSDIAYGDQGRPGIPKGATLVFEVELLSISAPKAPMPQMPPQGGGQPGH